MQSQAAHQQRAGVALSLKYKCKCDNPSRLCGTPSWDTSRTLQGPYPKRTLKGPLLGPLPASSHKSAKALPLTYQCPGRQAAHAVALVDGAYVPAAHLVHFLLPCDEKVPGAQFCGTTEPDEQDVPAGHAARSVARSRDKFSTSQLVRVGAVVWLLVHSSALVKLMACA